MRTCKHLIRILGADHEKLRAPESFYGLTRGKSSFRIPVKFMSFGYVKDIKNIKKNTNFTLASVKLNGMFARWSDGQLRTKSGRVLKHAPSSVTEHLPRDMELDGEIYHPDFSLVRLAVLGTDWHPDVHFVVFDVYDTTLPFEQRWQKLEQYRKHHPSKPFKMVKQYDRDEWTRLVDQVIENKEEGLVLRDPKGMYETDKRSKTTLKWKPISYGTAKVITVDPSKRTARFVETGSETEFVAKIGSNIVSLTQNQTVRFSYYGRTEHGRPEFPKILNE